MLSETVCPYCGETYLYEADYRSGVTTKLSNCGCDREKEQYRTFLRMKGLEKEFEEFRKKEEKKHWHEWIVQFVISPYFFFEEFEDFYKEKIARFMTPDEVLEAVAEGLRAGSSKPLEELIERLSSLLNMDKKELKKKLLALVA